MRRPLAFIGLLSLACASGAWAADTALTSTMIDGSLFRDGEVTRSAEVHGAWTLVCDDILRLNRRFCSLKSAPIVLGAAKLELTVSTGDDGAPAAMVRLPFGLALVPGIVVSAEPERRANGRKVPIALCDRDGCEAAWSLSNTEIDVLRRGKPLQLSMQGWTAVRLLGQGTKPPPIVATVTGIGFADALAASLR